MISNLSVSKVVRHQIRGSCVEIPQISYKQPVCDWQVLRSHLCYKHPQCQTGGNWLMWRSYLCYRHPGCQIGNGNCGDHSFVINNQGVRWSNWQVLRSHLCYKQSRCQLESLAGVEITPLLQTIRVSRLKFISQNFSQSSS